MSLVILASDCESTWIVVRELQRHHEISAVIVESPVSRQKFLKRRIERLGWIRVTGQVLFQLFTRFLAFESRHARAEIIAANNWDTTRPTEITRHCVTSVNHPRVRKLLQELNPTVIVINGTRILGKNLLESVSAPMINMHAGMTPMYRGVHGGYWALARDDEEHAGVTVHLVDSGIDTGDVLYQATIDVEAHDNFTTYPLLQIEAGLPWLVKAVSDAFAGNLQPRTVEGKSELFYHPTIWGYLWRRFMSHVR